MIFKDVVNLFCPVDGEYAKPFSPNHQLNMTMRELQSSDKPANVLRKIMIDISDDLPNRKQIRNAVLMVDDGRLHDFIQFLKLFIAIRES